jgi:hypothetical protein
MINETWYKKGFGLRFDPGPEDDAPWLAEQQLKDEWPNHEGKNGSFGTRFVKQSTTTEPPPRPRPRPIPSHSRTRSVPTACRAQAQPESERRAGRQRDRERAPRGRELAIRPAEPRYSSMHKLRY